MRSETVIIDLTDRLDARRCLQWLAEVRKRTADRALHRLVDDVSNELRMLIDAAGHLAEELTDLVVGAMASVEAALDVATIRA